MVKGRVKVGTCIRARAKARVRVSTCMHVIRVRRVKVSTCMYVLRVRAKAGVKVKGNGGSELFSPVRAWARVCEGGDCERVVQLTKRVQTIVPTIHSGKLYTFVCV